MRLMRLLRLMRLFRLVKLLGLARFLSVSRSLTLVRLVKLVKLIGLVRLVESVPKIQKFFDFQNIKNLMKLYAKTYAFIVLKASLTNFGVQILQVVGGCLVQLHFNKNKLYIAATRISYKNAFLKVKKIK